MAALVAGVQYGLSSHSNFHENKSLIFVKLTDSAQRAIEDYLRNRTKINQNPTIQFLGNEGQLFFPSTKSTHGNFTFSLSSNQDIEGPQGGFECVQQTGPKNLESLGALPCKMRIQANDDVYETTRHRMHVAEENNKNKCTRVIRSNEAIGRKVKVKGTAKALPPLSQLNSSTNSRHRDSSNFSTATGQPSKLSLPHKSHSNNLISTRTQVDNQKKLTDIMRRPLKERLIHLLALRPFKRPELYDRINREGVREKEKSVMANILKQIAFMRDNTYHLHRCIWNDVQEDWPFYTEQEKAMLKRRKPQNLTPPGSSDGSSSGSGQSPNSTHPGSPPAITAPPPGLLSSKRPGYYEGNDGLPTKRQRISHYRKPDIPYSNSSGDDGRLNATGGTINNWDNRQQQRQRQSLQYAQLQQRNTCVSVTKSDMQPTSDNEEINTGTSLATNKINVLTDSSSTNRVIHNIHNDSNHNNYRYQQQEHEQKQQCISLKKGCNNNEGAASIETHTIYSEQISTERRNNDDENCRNREKEKYTCELNYSSECSSNAKTSSANSNTVGDSFLSFSTSPCYTSSAPDHFRNTEYPDYLTYYTTINSSEQRKRYKDEFNAYYKEYRKLHVQVVEISKHFSQLEEELRKKSENGNVEGYEATKSQILEEYARTKNVNSRFYYLHEKLGHIKKLVSEYDAHVHKGSTTSSNNSEIINSPDFNGENFHQDLRETRCNLTDFSVEEPITCPPKMSHIS